MSSIVLIVVVDLFLLVLLQGEMSFEKLTMLHSLDLSDNRAEALSSSNAMNDV